MALLVNVPKGIETNTTTCIQKMKQTLQVTPMNQHYADNNRYCLGTHLQKKKKNLNKINTTTQKMDNI